MEQVKMTLLHTVSFVTLKREGMQGSSMDSLVSSHFARGSGYKVIMKRTWLYYIDLPAEHDHALFSSKSWAVCPTFMCYSFKWSSKTLIHVYITNAGSLHCTYWRITLVKPVNQLLSLFRVWIHPLNSRSAQAKMSRQQCECEEELSN